MSSSGLFFIGICVWVSIATTCILQPDNTCLQDCYTCVETVYCRDDYACQINCHSFNACNHIEAVAATSISINCARESTGANCDNLIVNGQNAGDMKINCTAKEEPDDCKDAQFNCGAASCEIYCSSISCVNVILNASLSATYNCTGECDGVIIIPPNLITQSPTTASPTTAIPTVNPTPGPTIEPTVEPTTANPTKSPFQHVQTSTAGPTNATITPTVSSTLKPTIQPTDDVPDSGTTLTTLTLTTSTVMISINATDPGVHPTANDESKSDNLMLYIIICVAAVAGCIICVGFIIFISRYNPQNSDHALINKNHQSTVNLATIHNFTEDSNNMIMENQQDDDDEEMYINNKNVDTTTLNKSTKQMDLIEKEDDSIEEMFKEQQSNQQESIVNTTKSTNVTNGGGERLSVLKIEGNINKIGNGVYIKDDISDSDDDEYQSKNAVKTDSNTCRADSMYRNEVHELTIEGNLDNDKSIIDQTNSPSGINDGNDGDV